MDSSRRLTRIAVTILSLVFLAGTTRIQRPAVQVQADRVVVEKSARKLTLWSHGRPLKTYRVCLGSNPTGPKQREGDGRTPEGLYRIEGRNAQSAYHLALRVSYPNESDRARARRLGVKPGGEIMIHGTPNRWRVVSGVFAYTDWTAGCIAVTNPEIEEIWKLVPNGTTVDIRP